MQNPNHTNKNYLLLQNEEGTIAVVTRRWYDISGVHLSGAWQVLKEDNDSKILLIMARLTGMLAYDKVMGW